ncbi:MAG: hypothetical protein LUC17_01280 [Oscillospiraceae bacterium]|nr:hypothetical protein [Oscillospiraceae bacterium]
MAMTCGAARSASRGSSSKGDQGQKTVPDYDGEVSLHSIQTDRTYIVYRPINPDYATTMAQLMITACNNANIGYSQARRTGIWKYGVNATTPTDCDCSSLVSYCIYKATGKDLGAFTTAGEHSALMNSGLFTKVGTYTSGMTIYNGDVFVTKTSGHTYMAVKGNPRSGSDTELSGTYTDGGAYDSACGYITRDSINVDALQQYIVTVDRNTPNPSYSTWLKNKVAGVIIEAGYLYNAQHTVVSNPRNPYIQQQCTNAVSAGMPYGLYWDVKAKTVDEAKSELYQLQFLIRKYPPVLGMWLHLSLTASTATNNNIIDTYYQEFIILGLKGNIGFYVTKSELEKITWSKYQEDWWLWLVNHVSDTTQLSSLIDPSFFVLP